MGPRLPLPVVLASIASIASIASMAAALPGCSGGDHPADAAVGIDARVAVDAAEAEEDAAPPDAGIDAFESVDAPDIDAPAIDAAPRLDAFFPDDAWAPDAYERPDTALTDVGTDAFRAEFGPQQCSPSIACPSGPAACTFPPPGGVCSCEAEGDACPTGTRCDAALRTCVRGCTSDLDCVVGMSCDAASHRCLLRRCNASAPCPSAYVCSHATGDGFCLRPSCESAPCPSPFLCEDGVCVEPTP